MNNLKYGKIQVADCFRQLRRSLKKVEINKYIIKTKVCRYRTAQVSWGINHSSIFALTAIKKGGICQIGGGWLSIS